MKIKLSKDQWKQVIDSLNASDDVEFRATVKPIERIINRINEKITPRKTEVINCINSGTGWVTLDFNMDMRIYFGYELDFSADDVEIIINALNEHVEEKRTEIDDEVVAIDANDTDEHITDIKEHLSTAFKRANEAQSLEAIRTRIENNKTSKKENEKDKKIAELTAKVDTQQMAIKGKDCEISSLRSRIESAERHIYELECRLGRRCPDPIYWHGRPIDPRCRF